MNPEKKFEMCKRLKTSSTPAPSRGLTKPQWASKRAFRQTSRAATPARSPAPSGGLGQSRWSQTAPAVHSAPPPALSRSEPAPVETPSAASPHSSPAPSGGWARAGGAAARARHRLSHLSNRRPTREREIGIRSVRGLSLNRRRRPSRRQLP
ncbi:hypothetical protein EJ06DRAFT_181989 [Trichodelitschia bisporula]|uniref:Uncharacterized protein n=1 Tax=Trichodelitschia bisporula TaxID=703511 RepID=A0A6G1HMB4_9PEZI|nr:hypothetical protein EJ06DRAFT_181989 [Trichodelitschia bisporula]